MPVRRIWLVLWPFLLAWPCPAEVLAPAPTAPAAAAPAPALPPTAAPAAPSANKQTYMVAVSDGVKLATDVYLPVGNGPFPVLLTRTPYNRAGGLGTKPATDRGYVVVIQDMRGRFGSEGENLPFIGCGWADHADGADTVAWILQQPWCNGKVGTVGGSACGITQNLLAGAAPKGLAAQFIGVAAGNLYADTAYVGGAFRKEQIENWTSLNKFDPKARELFKAHPCYDEFWEKFDTTRRFPVMDVPAIHVGGWFDTFLQGTIDQFLGRQYHGAEGARGRQKLVLGPWVHGGYQQGRAGDLAFPNNQYPRAYDQERWFDCLLKGQDNGILAEPAVAYYVMGDVEAAGAPGNEWRHADVWPIPCAETPYYFQKDGGLAPARPSAAAPAFEEYAFDPADPCPTLGGRNLTIRKGPINQNEIEVRKDLVNFTSEALTEPLEVTGRIAARVFVSSSAADTDLSVRFCDVYGDWRSFPMAEGMLRLRHRNSFTANEPLKPGEIYEVTVDCWSISVVINKGHRIRVTVTSSNYPRFDLNPGTGKPWTEGCPFVRQTNRIYCDGEHPSRIILPVVKPKPPPSP